jgi:hypothetical protein
MNTIWKERALEEMEYFLHTLSFVPADKLTWSPTPTAKSALQIAVHVAAYSGRFASIIAAGKFPVKTGAEFRAEVEEAMQGITSVEQAEAMLRQGIADTCAALDNVKPEQIDSMIDSPQGQTPFLFFMKVPAMHLEMHAGQIDYLQTCWGDQEVHFKP